GSWLSSPPLRRHGGTATLKKSSLPECQLPPLNVSCTRPPRPERRGVPATCLPIRVGAITALPLRHRPSVVAIAGDGLLIECDAEARLRRQRKAIAADLRKHGEEVARELRHFLTTVLHLREVVDRGAEVKRRGGADGAKGVVRHHIDIVRLTPSR